MKFRVPAASSVEIDPDGAVIAGFTGRDRDEALAHLRELANEGVPVPEHIPTFYTVPAHLLVQTERLHVAHARTSGEAEAVILLPGEGDLYVTLGSDHTDRLAEMKDIAASKLACPKVLAEEAWPFADVIERWDQLELRSWVTTDGHRELYQQGSLAELLPPKDLLERIGRPGSDGRPDAMVFTGTLVAHGGIRPADRFEAELRDPAGGRSIQLAYWIEIIDLLTAETS